MLLAMLFCSFATFANYYYCEVLTGAKVIEVGNPRYLSDNGQPATIERTVAKRSYLSLTPYTVTDDINNARLYEADSSSEVEKLVKDEGDYFYSLLSEEEKESYWEHEEYLNCTYLIKFRDNDRYLNDRGRFARKDSAKIFETYADVKNACQNCEMKDECEIVRNL
jgi:hypothetical protein